MQKTEFKALVRVISKPSHKPSGFVGGNLQDLSTQKRKICELHAFLSLWTWSFLSCTKSALGFWWDWNFLKRWQFEVTLTHMVMHSKVSFSHTSGTKAVLPSTEATFCDSHANLSPFKQKSFLLDAKKTCSPRAPLNFRPTPWGHPRG
jgi:hypothetical protein